MESGEGRERGGYRPGGRREITKRRQRMKDKSMTPEKMIMMMNYSVKDTDVDKLLNF